VAMSECLHHDLSAVTGGKVGVSVVCPGWVKTNIADSERNRPSAIAARPVAERPPQDQMMQAMVRQAIEGGIPASEVAEQTFQAVVEGRFWVLTHPKTLKAVDKRMRGILEGKAPEFDPSAI